VVLIGLDHQEGGLWENLSHLEGPVALIGSDVKDIVWAEAEVA